MSRRIEDMTDEELEALVSQEAPAENTAQEVSPELSTGEAALAFGSKLSMGLGPTAAGAAAATVNYLQNGGSLSESKAIFDMARDDYNNTIAQAEKQFPTIAKVFNAAEFIQKAIPSSQAANFGISIADQIGKDGLSLESVAYGARNAAIGAIGGRALSPAFKSMGVVGRHIGEGVKKVPSYISKWGEAVDLSSAMEKIGVVTSGAKTALFNTLSSRGLDPDAFVKKLSEYEVNGLPIFQGTITQMRNASKEKVKQLGSELGEHMILIDSAAVPNIPASSFHRSISDIIDMISDTPVQKELDIANKIKEKMLDLQEKGILNLKDIHNFKEYVSRSINWEDMSAKNLNSRLEKLYFESSEYLKHAIDDVPIDQEIKSIYNAANEEYGNLMSLNRVISKEPGREFSKLAQTGNLSEKIKSFLSGPSQQVAQIFSNAASKPINSVLNSTIVKKASSLAGKVTPYLPSPPGITRVTEGFARDPSALQALMGQNAQASMGPDLSFINNDPTLEPMQKLGLAKVLTGFAGGMEHLSPYITKITEGIARDPDILNDLLAPAESAVDLTLSPVQRSTEDMLRKDSQIYNVIREADPVLAAKFNNALNEEQYDVLGELMSSMSNLPKMRKFIEPGIGWDNKVTNETEKAIIRERILGADLSVMQQMQQIEQLDKSGAIPQVQPRVELRQIAKIPTRSINGRKKPQY